MSAPDPNSRAQFVENPALPFVRWRKSGDLIAVSQFIGRMRYKHMVLVRGRLRACLRKNYAIFECPECGTPTYLACSPNHKAFFRHTKDTENCPVKTRGSLSRAAITARIYGLRRESLSHRIMKERIAACLSLDPQFSDVVIEKVMTGSSRNSGWRKPDVRARLTSRQVVFEAQVNSTFIDIIQARREFYAAQNAALLWLMPRFDPQTRRLCQDDIISQHRGTAFVVDSESVDKSHKENAFWVKSYTYDEQLGVWNDTFVAVRNLYFDYKTGGVYLPSQKQIEQRKFRELGLEIGDELYGVFEDRAKQSWKELRSLAATQGLQLSKYGPSIEFTRLIRAIASAMMGKPFGYGFKKLIEIPHNLAQCDWYCLRTFMRILKDSGHAHILIQQDISGKWATKERNIKTQWSLWNDGYLTSESERSVIKIMFPEYASFI